MWCFSTGYTTSRTLNNYSIRNYAPVIFAGFTTKKLSSFQVKAFRAKGSGCNRTAHEGAQLQSPSSRIS
eukprot:2621133-Pyramimonas_sp.AAC.3